jgi:hypothetical protein
MKKFTTACALLCLIAIAALASTPAALPNYAGTWTVDKDKSKDVPPMMANVTEMVVKQDDKHISIKPGSNDEVSYNLDGSKSKVQLTAGRFPGEATVYLEKKDDGKIVLHSERDLNIQGNAITIKVTEAWELSADGKTLTTSRTIESPRGTQNFMMVFNKKS